MRLRSLASSRRRLVSLRGLLAGALFLPGSALAAAPPPPESAQAGPAAPAAGAARLGVPPLAVPQARPDEGSDEEAVSPSGASVAAQARAELQPGPLVVGSREEYSFRESVLCPFCALTPQFPEGRSGLHWHRHWRSVGVTEYIAVPALLAAGFGSYSFFGSSTGARWSRPILFDSSVREGLRFGKASHRQTAERLSDALYYIETLHPMLVDPLITAWWARESPRVAWQMTVINAQAYGLTMLLNGLTKRFTARARPWATNAQCEQDPASEGCGSGGAYRSFYSGHSAITATGAGLICAHHTQLALYQNPVLDIGTCLVAVAGTATTGAMRISSDNHWASDVLIGHLMGYLSGYLLPTLVYYKQFRVTPHSHEDTSAPIIATLPLVTPDSIGVSVFGSF